MGHLFLNAFIRDISMAAEALSISSDFDIFAKPRTDVSPRVIRDYIQTVSVGGRERFGIFVPAENDTYMDLNIRLFVRGKLTAAAGKYLQAIDHTVVTKNFLRSLSCHCSLNLNRTTITRVSQ